MGSNTESMTAVSEYLIVVDAGGCAWPLASDTASVPDGDYGVDWGVISATDMREALRLARSFSRCEPIGMLSEWHARQAMAERPVRS